MKSVTLMLAMVTFTLVTAQTAEQWYPTGDPELIASDVGLIRLMTWADYAALAANLRGPRLVVLTERPPLSEAARFGVNFSFGGKNRSVAVDGSDETGYRFYADVDGNGKLTSDEMLTMVRTAGKWTARFHADVSETLTNVTETYPVEMTFTVDTAIPDGEAIAVPVLRKVATTVRRGVVPLGGSNLSFALLGQAGIYDRPGSEVVFDLRGRGIDLADSRSPDRFQVSDGKVTIAGVTYTFRVDRYGRGLALTATNGAMLTRPTLELGSIAPDVKFTDLDGRDHQLAEFRGRVVLMVFWATWCGPCRAEAPVIADVYRRFNDQGLVVVGINPNDALADVRKFIDEFHVAGLTSREPLSGPVHKLFRVTAWPTHFLIGRDGKIAANEIDASSLSDAVAAAIRSR